MGGSMAGGMLPREPYAPAAGERPATTTTKITTRGTVLYRGQETSI